MDGILEFIMNLFVDNIKNRMKLITDYQSIEEDLENQVEQLSTVLSSMQHRVEQARNNGDKIIEEVNRWLDKAQRTKDEVTSWEGDLANNTTRKCGPCLNCCKVYKLSKESIRKKENVVVLIEQSKNFSHVVFPSSPEGIQLVSSKGFTAFKSMMVSFNEVFRALQKDNTRIVGVVGMGGIGKTTLVTEAGRVAEEKKTFDQVLFVVVSQAPNIRKIQGELGDMLGLTYSRESDVGRAGQLRHRLVTSERKILIILDDVWNPIELADIGIPIDNDCCKLLLTTRREPVCTSMGCQETIRLKLLEEGEAWQLFKANAGGLLDAPSPGVTTVAQQIIKECHRLPLALVVVARAVRGEDWEGLKVACERLQRSRLVDIDAVDSDRNVYKCFQLSYDYLKAKDAKKCFLLCSLFPEDHEINVEELAKYALGFGLFQNAASFASVIYRVKNTIKELKLSCLLLKNEMADHVKMHDMVRDAAIWITTEVKEPFVVPTPLDRVINLELGEAVAVSLLPCPMNDRFPDQPSCPRLKVLLCAQRVPLQLRDNCFQGFQTLRVLDLTAAKNLLELVLPSSLKCLKNLQTLLLRRWKLQGDISMIGSLSRLEILSFSGSLIKELPIELGELSELRILDLSACKELSMDSSIEVQRKLTRLEAIYMPSQPPTLAFEDDDE